MDQEFWTFPARVQNIGKKTLDTSFQCLPKKWIPRSMTVFLERVSPTPAVKEFGSWSTITTSDANWNMTQIASVLQWLYTYPFLKVIHISFMRDISRYHYDERESEMPIRAIPNFSSVSYGAEQAPLVSEMSQGSGMIPEISRNK